MTRSTGLFWRALAAFLLLPGMVAFVVPWLLHAGDSPPAASGVLLISLGTVLLLWCVRDFYVAGKGSLAPWAPPERLVETGLYRLSRNPMYVAVLIILCGWALAFGDTLLWVYAAGLALAFHLRVVLFEEPWLSARYSKQWTEYSARVPRWLAPAPGRRKHRRPGVA